MSKRIKKLVTAIPTRAEVEILVADIRQFQIGHIRITAQREAAIKAIDDRIGPTLAEIKAVTDEKTALVQAWAEANPAEFEKKKSLELTHGTIGFRTGQPKLVLLSRAFTWAKVLTLVEQFLPAFIRGVPEIDKEAIIAQRDDKTLQAVLPTVGLKVTQDEGFFIDPKIEDINTTVKKEAA